MIKLSILAAAAALAVFASPAAAQNLVLNGDFELGLDPGSYNQVDVGDPDITFWTVTSGNVDYIGTYWLGQGGAGRSVDLAGSALGTISQSFATQIGQAYQVSFYASRNPDGGDAERTGTVDFGGSSETFSYSLLTSVTNMNWQLYTYSFVADSLLTVLSFSADASAGCCYGPALDTVAVVAVPEPEMWAMLLLGFGAIGLQMRRRRRGLRTVTA